MSLALVDKNHLSTQLLIEALKFWLERLQVVSLLLLLLFINFLSKYRLKINNCSIKEESIQVVVGRSRLGRKVVSMDYIFIRLWRNRTSNLRSAIKV